MGMKYKVFDKPTILTVKTKRPEKWILIDTETGEVYKGNPLGHWDKMEKKTSELFRRS